MTGNFPYEYIDYKKIGLPLEAPVDMGKVVQLTTYSIYCNSVFLLLPSHSHAIGTRSWYPSGYR